METKKLCGSEEYVPRSTCIMCAHWEVEDGAKIEEVCIWKELEHKDNGVLVAYSLTALLVVALMILLIFTLL